MMDPRILTIARKTAQAYGRETGFPVVVVGSQGERLWGKPSKRSCACGSNRAAARIKALQQSLVWGEAVVNECCNIGFALWGIPVLWNGELLGGLLVEGVDLEGGGAVLHARVRHAANRLVEFATEANLLHPAVLELARQRMRREQDRFLAIEASKQSDVRDDLRGIYLREEPGLLSAIKQGNRGEAFEILNRVLVGIYACAGDRMELLKSCVLELVVMMSRAAVEAGAESVTMLGEHYRSLAALAAIEDEEDLAAWVRRMLESLISGIHRNNRFPHSLLLMRATAYMRENLAKPLRREEVARVAGLSPSHFSRTVSERMGKTFRELLTQMRVDRAREWLVRTDMGMQEVAESCGFVDASHMGKCFRKAGLGSPARLRARRSADSSPE